MGCKNLSMAPHEEETQEPVDSFEENPENLRDNDEINDAEEAFMEGYEKDADEEDEEKADVLEEEF